MHNICIQACTYNYKKNYIKNDKINKKRNRTQNFSWEVYISANRKVNRKKSANFRRSLKVLVRA